ncbi:MAG: acyltransferase [Frankiaceae bacterium]|nr:acyltransferase [Frankiaceae bacterium]MBV9871199.1 acyltransferase [Frankiaceae bacterium]
MSSLRRLPWWLRYRGGAALASRWRQWEARVTHLHADIKFGPGTHVGPRFGLAIDGPSRLHIGAHCDLRRDFFCEIAPGGIVEIGAGSIFTSSALIQISTSLTIGERAVFGQAVFIADGNHNYGDPDRHLLDQGYDFRPITIGAGAVITSKCTILNSVGEGAVIGAGSVVRNPIPPHCLAIGAPARVVEYFKPAEERGEAQPSA